MLKTAKPDIAQRLARFKPVRMPFDPSALSANERQMIDQLVAASRAIESIYWRQSDPAGLALYKALASVDTPLAKDVRHYLFINGSRWDLVRENEPFVGAAALPPGHALYPADLTRAAVEAYVAAHPGAKPALFDPFHNQRYRGDTRGIGLGLYIVHEIVRAHGGTVDVVSSSDTGTTFTVRLPRAAG